MGKTLIHEGRELRNKLVKYAKSILNYAKQMSEAISSGRLTEIEKIIYADKNNDQHYFDLIDDCVWFITKERPLASDMRQMIGFIFILRELERIGDGFVNVGKAARFCQPAPRAVKVFYADISPMYEMVCAQLLLVINALTNFSEEELMKLIAEDNRIDKYYQTRLTESILSLSHIKSVQQLQLTNNKIMTYKSLERTADHIIAICWEIIYIATGEHRLKNRGKVGNEK